MNHRGIVMLWGLGLAGLTPLLAGGCAAPAAPPAATAPVPAPAPVPVTVRSGAEIFAACQLCHSTREMQRGPLLEGLPAWSVALQLRKFRDGVRGRDPANKSELLMGAGESLLHDDEEIRRVAGHIASLPPVSHLLTVRGDKQRGKLVYLQCINCHGVKGEGRPDSQSPPLNTLEDWFQLDQLRKFKAGLRGKHPQDAAGNAMRLAVLGLSDEDLRNVTRYVAEDLAAAPPLPSRR